MWSLLVWHEGDKPQLFLIESEKLDAYKEVKGKYLNGIDDEKLGDRGAAMIEHLAWTLGMEPCYSDKLPTLEEYLANAPKSDGDNTSKPMNDVEAAERNAKLNKGPWSNYKLSEPYDISRYVNDVFMCGWYP